MADKFISAQQIFLEQVKQKANPVIPLVDQLADALHVSNDGAYRRLRGTTVLTLDEAVALAEHFSLPLPEIKNLKTEGFVFQRSTFRETLDDFGEYVKKTEIYLTQIRDSKQKFGIYAAKDIPVFYFFHFPELASFKMYFWLKTLKGGSDIKSKKFSFDSVPKEYFDKAKSVAKLYAQIPFTELWNEETINSTLNQIQYFADANLFDKKQTGIMLCDKLQELFEVIQLQAETGLKYFKGEKMKPDVPYELYFNDLIALDNTIYTRTESFEMTMVSYNAMDYLFTFNPIIGHEVLQFLETQKSKSQVISKSSEKERNKFFKRIEEKISLLKTKFS